MYAWVFEADFSSPFDGMAVISETREKAIEHFNAVSSDSYEENEWQIKKVELVEGTVL